MDLSNKSQFLNCSQDLCNRERGSWSWTNYTFDKKEEIYGILLGIGRFSKFFPKNDLIKGDKWWDSSSLWWGMIWFGWKGKGRALVLKTGFSVKIF